MAWPGKSQIYAYTILNSMNKGTSSLTCSTDSFKIALYGTGTPVNTGTTLVSTEYGASWNTCTEVSGTGYTAGGSALVSPTSTQSTNTWVFACSTANSWTSATLASVYGALIYDTTNANAGLCYLDFLGAQSVTGGTFTVTYAPNICTITLT